MRAIGTLPFWECCPEIIENAQLVMFTFHLIGLLLLHKSTCAANLIYMIINVNAFCRIIHQCSSFDLLI